MATDDRETRRDSSMPPGCAPTFFERRVGSALAGHVRSIVGYREDGQKLTGSLEMAPLVVPLIISFGEPFEIALGRAPARDDVFGSFTSGLFPGFVMINSTGRSECVQVDFTPIGAFRFFGMPMRELSNRMVTLDDLADRDILALRQRLGETLDWDERFAQVEAFLARRLAEGPASTRAIGWAYRRILAGRGSMRVADLATALGWSRKHLNQRFHEEIGIGPKAVSRMVRFNHALELARTPPEDGWAGIAAECGFSDQAHLVREFRTFSGVSPTALALATR